MSKKKLEILGELMAKSKRYDNPWTPSTNTQEDSEKSLVIKQDIIHLEDRWVLNSETFNVSSFEDLKNQLITHFASLIDSGVFSITKTNHGDTIIHSETRAEIEGELLIYYDSKDAEINKNALGFGNSVYYTAPCDIDFSPLDWDTFHEVYIEESELLERWGLNELISNPPEKFLEKDYKKKLINEDFLKPLFEIFKRAANGETFNNEAIFEEKDSSKNITSELTKEENINNNKVIAFHWEKISNIEDEIASKVREQVLNYVFQYYNVNEVEDLTKKQINEIIKFKDEVLTNHLHLKNGFNYLIEIWKN